MPTSSINLGYARSMIVTSALQKVSKILVPIDGSESSMRAADAAIELARRYKNNGDGGTTSSVEVIALYVVDAGAKFELFGKYGFNYSEYAKAAQDEGRKVTENWFSNIRKKADANNILFRAEVTDNSSLSIVGEIVNYAEREEVDIIIIGTRGHSEYKKLLIGSVSSGVVTYSPITVIVVR
jgi:nucleotide-binding universal stress UspA family protein